VMDFLLMVGGALFAMFVSGIINYKKSVWVGLTDEEIKEGESKGEQGYGFIQGALWAEAKLKEKNT
jgi:hypothetical protein